MLLGPVVVIQHGTSRLTQDSEGYPEDHVTETTASSAPVTQRLSHGDERDLEEHAGESISIDHVCWDTDEDLMQNG